MTFGYSSDIYLSIVADTGYLPTVSHAEVLAKILASEIAGLCRSLEQSGVATDKRRSTRTGMSDSNV
jgi:hypothetical protein